MPYKDVATKFNNLADAFQRMRSQALDKILRERERGERVKPAATVSVSVPRTC